jgi:hypothetical protein
VYFKRWIDEMEKQGADLSQVKIKGTEVSLYSTACRKISLNVCLGACAGEAMVHRTSKHFAQRRRSCPNKAQLIFDVFFDSLVVRS